MRRTFVVLTAVGALMAAPLVAAPSQAVVRTDPDFSGFTTQATATPLRIEVYEPAIPIPSDPQAEMDFSYTRVDGTSGPTGSARASALWPGDSIGEGFKTFGEQLGLPEALYQNGYPAQVNAQSPGDITQAAQEPLPGMVARVNATDKKAIAKAGYGTGGDVPEGHAGDGTTPKPANPLTSLLGGDLSALGNILTGTATGNGDNPVSTSPLGMLSLLVNANGMQSISTTDYSGDKVIATATSRLGELDILGGLIKLTGIEVVAKTTSNIADGGKVSTRVNYGGMTIAGTPFAFTSDGFVAGGAPVAAPGLPTNATDALKALGISIEIPKPTATTDGAQATAAAQGPTITIDTAPLRSKLPDLPLADLINKFPDQAAQLKSLLLALTEAHPKIVVKLGGVTSQAETVAAIGDDTTAAGPTTSDSSAASSASGPAAGSGTAAPPATSAEAAPAASTAPTTTTPVKTVSAVPGLPPLGSVPGMLTLLGMLLAAGAGWYLRRAGGLLFGVGATCSHGLKAGIPDLRKA
ncbi:choice-of-anchor P family protein [Nocardioides pocheonensis]|uniref:Choice-of-anchor G family protein n=1 Tax=Nocardioides pocheonensis TaxID=661485 RepID=A0A3N0GUW7_9ACTN|nr:choice-of-anchor P family protein [Nocardioides pocheonensis]RNM16247.1 hypothetical protein EFL26_05665 [Nocardioides pocheonensis]